MSIAPFDSTVTLFTPLNEGVYEKKIIPYVHAEVSEGIDAAACRATVYIPIHGKRALKYVSPKSRIDGDSTTFTVKPGQLLLPYAASEDSPPENALTVGIVSEYFSGSRRIRHLKISAYKIPEPEPEETPEEDTEENPDEESAQEEVTQ